MSFWASSYNAVEKTVSNYLGLNDSGASIYDAVADKAKDLVPHNGKAWNWTGQDWSKIYGYQFIVSFVDDIKDNSGKVDYIYTLPIPPQTFNIRMIPASQATPTLGGVVEETRANTFWLISMSGTTGIAVSRKADDIDSRTSMATKFRDTISTTGLLSGALAGINSAISKIAGAGDALVDAGKSVMSGNSVTGIPAALEGVVGSFNDVFLPSIPYSASAVSQKSNGYTEIQELHRFLYTYSLLKSRTPSQSKLRFRCYKTSQIWDCIIQDFNIQQSAQNPFLYRYTISLKGWNVKDADTKDNGKAFDRFGPQGDLKAVNLVNPTLFNQIKSSYKIKL